MIRNHLFLHFRTPVMRVGTDGGVQVEVSGRPDELQIVEDCVRTFGKDLPDMKVRYTDFTT